jgi:hypothetical protein
MPEIVRRIWQIVYVDSDGRGRERKTIEWQADSKDVVLVSHQPNLIWVRLL